MSWRKSCISTAHQTNASDHWNCTRRERRSRNEDAVCECCHFLAQQTRIFLLSLVRTNNASVDVTALLAMILINTMLRARAANHSDKRCLLTASGGEASIITACEINQDRQPPAIHIKNIKNTKIAVASYLTIRVACAQKQTFYIDSTYRRLHHGFHRRCLRDCSFRFPYFCGLMVNDNHKGSSIVS